MTLKSETVNPQIADDWKQLLWPFFQNESFLNLKKFLQEEKKQNQTIYPPGKVIFNAFNLCKLSEVKVVIMGQDPYHGPGQAHGLAFSVPIGIDIPPSLMNIYKEIHQDLGSPLPVHGNLEHWAKQGVLLLNSSLTVRAHLAGSHQNKGWEEFTDQVIQTLSNTKAGLVFLLWGKNAAQKEAYIDSQKHFILKAPHPSPLSAHRGFLGCRHFSKTNQILMKQGFTPIQWTQP